MKYSSETKRKILEELVYAYTVPPQEENEITIREFSEASSGLSIKHASIILDELVRKGEYTKRRVVSSQFGRACMAYRKADEA